MECTRAAGVTATEIFDRIDRQLSVINWMMELQLAAGLAVLLLTLRIWAKLP